MFSKLADCLLKVVRRNLDDAEVEIWFENEKAEQRVSMRLKLGIGQRFDGFPTKPSNKTKIDKH